ncbi:CD209 antigen-like [Scyliorhinus canicula]|uniref:CD209 antigen-like n=1 Tax=Scyliorhinus canicula TaxID=7830 RepID=UPI0018F41311|nr:CD209 antigen-like [Scyliorhinus canicula]
MTGEKLWLPQMGAMMDTRLKYCLHIFNVASITGLDVYLVLEGFRAFLGYKFNLSNVTLYKYTERESILGAKSCEALNLVKRLYVPDSVKTEEHCNWPQDMIPQSSDDDSEETDDEQEAEEDYEGLSSLFASSDDVITNEKHEELKESSDNPKGNDSGMFKDESDKPKETNLENTKSNYRTAEFTQSGSTGLQSALYIHSHTWNLITSDNWERERFEERNFMPDMMLIGVLLLAALFSSEVAANLLIKSDVEKWTFNQHDTDELEKQLCPNGLVSFGHCFLFVAVKMNWINAERYCQDLVPPSHLVSIHSVRQSYVIHRIPPELNGSHAHFWIGLNDIKKEGVFEWTDGSPLQFTKWHDYEPSNNENEHCVEVVHWSRIGWNDADCSDELNFLCSRKLIYD